MRNTLTVTLFHKEGGKNIMCVLSTLKVSNKGYLKSGFSFSIKLL